MDPSREGSFDASITYKSHGLLPVPSDILQIESKMTHPVWDFKGEPPPQWDTLRDYDLRVAEVDRWLQYLRSGHITEDIFFQEILPVLGVERDNSGDIISYHATNFDSLVKIIQEGCIKPPKETDNRAWRNEGEEEPSKIEKIYLATNFKIPYIADSIPGGSYILQVQVPPSNLRIDEDSHTGEFSYAWVYSLAKGQTCSYAGNIDRYQIYARLASEVRSLNINVDEVQSDELREVLLHSPNLFKNKNDQLEILKKMNKDVEKIHVYKRTTNNEGYLRFVKT